MKDKIVIITGASDGIGKAAANELTQHGAEVVIIGRSAEKTKAVAEELHAAYYVADFSILAEVKQLGAKLLEKYPRIDVLINNAGGIFGHRELTVDGYEKTMQVNHLSHFLLTQMLLDTLIKSRAIIINTSSVAHQIFSKFDINDVNMENSYSANSAYGNAKLENILFTKELDRRYRDKGISAVAFHPGNVATNFASTSNGFLRFMYQTPLKYFAGLISSDKGAETMVWLATSKPGKDWEIGEYYVNKKLKTTHPIARDTATARSLWEQSKSMLKAWDF
jgi:NAD(P)-dependent dehydrogenase (short-subunit alcohol dehydrogenase family)